MPRQVPNTLSGPAGLPIHFLGPALDAGPLPALFYFSLSGLESLTLDPYNQPLQPLLDGTVRVFSFDLPLHGVGHDPRHALHSWALALAQGDNILGHFLDQAEANIHWLRPWLTAGRIATAGLSRGGFTALHLAARLREIGAVLGFAPVTDLLALEHFKHLSDNSAVHSLDLREKLKHLARKRVRLYVGNRDVAVGTESCFAFVQALTEEAHAHRVRSAQVELTIYPSIGYRGHGTPREIFEAGGQWIKQILLEPS